MECSCVFVVVVVIVECSVVKCSGSIDLSTYLSICLSVYLSICGAASFGVIVVWCNVVWCSVI